MAVARNRLADDLEDYVVTHGAWPTLDEVRAAIGLNRTQAQALLDELIADGTIHVGPNGRIRLLPAFRFRWM